MLLAALSLGSCAPPLAEAKILLLGDVMLGRGVAHAHSEGTWDATLAALLPITSKVDLTAANLESPLTVEAQVLPDGFDLRGPPEAVRALSHVGISLVTLANNHALDAGETGLQQTLAVLREAGISDAGPAATPLLVTVHGLSFAFIALDDVSRTLDVTQISRTVGLARENSQAVIVSIHWGSEYQRVPDSRQRQVAQALADAGASVIWGHHPHVMQPVEWIRGTSLAYPTLVAFSLGNAMFDQAGPPDTRRGAALRFSLGTRGVMDVQAYGFTIDPKTMTLQPAAPETLLALEKELDMVVSAIP